MNASRSIGQPINAQVQRIRLPLVGGTQQTMTIARLDRSPELCMKLNIPSHPKLIYNRVLDPPATSMRVFPRLMSMFAVIVLWQY